MTSTAKAPIIAAPLTGLDQIDDQMRVRVVVGMGAEELALEPSDSDRRAPEASGKRAPRREIRAMIAEMTDATDPFHDLVGSQLTVDMRRVWIVSVHQVPQAKTARVELVLGLGNERSKSNEQVLIALCDQAKSPLWVLDQLRDRELHAGFKYEL